jgi:hypothetical protein
MKILKTILATSILVMTVASCGTIKSETKKIDYSDCYPSDQLGSTEECLSIYNSVDPERQKYGWYTVAYFKFYELNSTYTPVAINGAPIHSVFYSRYVACATSYDIDTFITDLYEATPVTEIAFVDNNDNPVYVHSSIYNDILSSANDSSYTENIAQIICDGIKSGLFDKSPINLSN